MIATIAKKLFIVVALIAGSVEVEALTVYSTLGQPGDVYSYGNGWLVNGSANPPQPYVGEAFAFTPTGSGTLSSISLGLSAGNANIANDLANISIASNTAGNLPGSALETFLNVQPNGQFGVEKPVITLNSATTPFLQAGVTYWLWVRPANSTAAIVVNQNSLGLQSSQAQEFSPSAWLARGSKTTFAFSVDVVSVPEPSVVGFLSFGAVLVGWRLRAREKSLQT